MKLVVTLRKYFRERSRQQRNAQTAVMVTLTPGPPALAFRQAQRSRQSWKKLRYNLHIGCIGRLIQDLRDRINATKTGNRIPRGRVTSGLAHGVLHVHLAEHHPGKIDQCESEEEEGHCHQGEFNQGLSPARFTLKRFEKTRLIYSFRR